MKRRRNFIISVVGLGYVGLCTSVAFAQKGFKVFGVDTDKIRIKAIQKGELPFYEPRLQAMTRKALGAGTLNVTDDAKASAKANVTFLTVGTPSKPNGSIDLSYVKSATESLGRVLQGKSGYHLVVVKSTVVPGTTSTVVGPRLERASGRKIGAQLGLCSNPEFLSEGTAIRDALHPDKIVIGSSDKKSSRILQRLYTQFFDSDDLPIIVTSSETAELVKYASNAFLATKVSFINTIANIAQDIRGTDVNDVARALGHDPRIGPLFLKAGPGYGGSCFHKDLQALISHSRRNGYSPGLLATVENVNDKQADRVLELSKRLTGRLRGKKVAILGLAFKKNTDDLREAASLKIIDRLRKEGARVVAYDPMASKNFKTVFGKTVSLASDTSSALKGADCAIVLTEWEEFGKIRAKDFLRLMRTSNLVDARRIYDPSKFVGLNFAAIGLGP